MANPSDPFNLIEHIGAILIILNIVFGLLVAAVAFIVTRIWLNIDNLHKEVKQFLTLHYECQRDLPKTFLLRTTFEDFHVEWTQFLRDRRTDWAKYWDAFNGHRHDKDSGAVVRKNGS